MVRIVAGRDGVEGGSLLLAGQVRAPKAPTARPHHRARTRLA